MEFRVSQPKRRLDERRIRRGSELDQFRPYLGPYRLRFIRAIRRMYRALDRVQTVISPPGDFVALAGLICGGVQAPIIPHPLRNCGSLPPKSPTTLGAPSVAYQYRGCRCPAVPRNPSWLSPPLSCRRQSGRRDGYSCASANRHLPGRPEGRDAGRRPLALSHRSRHQASVLVSAGRKRRDRAGPAAKHQPRRHPLRPQIPLLRSRARSIESRSPTRGPNGCRNNPAPNPIFPPMPNRERPATVTAPSIPDGKRAIGANVLAPTPLAATRWPDSSGVNCFEQPSRSAHRRSPIRPPTRRKTTVRTSCNSSRSSPGRARADGSRDGKADRVIADAACGDGRRARDGRHHCKPGRQDRPRARPARHAPQAACDVGFRPYQFRPYQRRSPAPMLPDEEAPLRPRQACTIRVCAQERPHPRAPRERPRVPEDRERQVTEMLSRLARSSQS